MLFVFLGLCVCVCAHGCGCLRVCGSEKDPNRECMDAENVMNAKGIESERRVGNMLLSGVCVCVCE